MTVKFGIIGPGGIANRFATVLNTAENAELTAVASSKQSRADQFAKKHGAKNAYKGYKDLVNDPEVDAVYIALTHNFHYEAAKLCLLHGKSVLCEKPLVTTKQDAEDLAALAKEKNLLLMEAMWTRCLPTFIQAKQWIANGKIGDVRLVNASFCFNIPFDPEHRLYNPKLAGGALLDAGVYPIEFTTGILGENPTEVKGVATICETGVDDYAAISMKFNSGALATLSCGLRANTNRNAHIYGTNGHIIVYNFLGSHKCELYDKDNNLIDSFEADFADGFIYEIEHFTNLYQKSKTESDLIPLADNIACAEIFDELMAQWGIKRNF